MIMPPAKGDLGAPELQEAPSATGDAPNPHPKPAAVEKFRSRYSRLVHPELFTVASRQVRPHSRVLKHPPAHGSAAHRNRVATERTSVKPLRGVGAGVTLFCRQT
jgi:hypothetical protein